MTHDIFLFSSASLEQYPSNTLSHFCNHLSQTLSLKKDETYECGIITFGISRKILAKSESHVMLRKRFNFSRRDLYIGLEANKLFKHLHTGPPEEAFQIDRFNYAFACDVTGVYDALCAKTIYLNLTRSRNLVREKEALPICKFDEINEQCLVSSKRKAWCLVRKELVDEKLVVLDKELLQGKIIKHQTDSYYLFFFGGGSGILSLKVPRPELIVTPEIIFVHLDIAQQPKEFHMYSNCSQILAVKHNVSFNSEYLYFEAIHPIYLPILTKQISDITVRFSDEKFNTLHIDMSKMTFCNVLVRKAKTHFPFDIEKMERGSQFITVTSADDRFPSNRFDDFRVRLKEPIHLNTKDFDYEIALSQITGRFSFAQAQLDLKVGFIPVERTTAPFDLLIPKGSYFETQDHFIRYINEAIEENNNMIHFSISGLGRLKISNQLGKMFILAPFEFFKLLGLETYALEHTQSKNTFYLTLASNFESEFPINLNCLMPNFLTVYSNIVSRQIAAQVGIQLLRIIPLAKEDTLNYETKQFPTLSYSKTDQSVIEEIHFLIRDDSGLQVLPRFPNEKVVLTLHLISKIKTKDLFGNISTL